MTDPEANVATSDTRALWASALAGLLLVGVVSAAFGVHAVAVLSVVVAGFLFLGSPALGGEVLGPLYCLDLIRLAKRNRGTILRCLYALSLLFGLCFVYAKHQPAGDLFTLDLDHAPRVPLQELASLAEQFTIVVVFLQAAAILLVTPAYLAGAIAEEKERRTLELLFTTHLTNRQIVLGKMCARLTHVAGLLLTGLPILSLTQLFGGVDALVLAAHFVVAGLTLLSVGSICILCSVLARTVVGAMAASYATLLVLNLVCLCPPCFFLVSPFGYAYGLEQSGLARYLGGAPFDAALAMIVPYAVVHGGISFYCLFTAVRRLRQEVALEAGESGRPSTVPPEARHGGKQTGRPGDGEAGRPRVAPRSLGPALPLDCAYPLFWKEAYHGRHGLMTEIGLNVAIVLSMVFFAGVCGLLLQMLGQVTPSELLVELRRFLRVCVCILSVLFCVGAGFRAAGSIARERDRRTLDSLLMLPGARRDIVVAKWLGAVVRLRYLAYFLGVLWGLGLIGGVFHPVAIMLSAVAVTVHVVFAASVGLALSARCRSTTVAHLLMALVLFAWFIGTGVGLFFWPPVSPVGPDTVSFVMLAVQLNANPPVAWWTLGFSWPAASRLGTARAMAAIVAGSGLYALAAWRCWRAACQPFAELQRPCSRTRSNSVQ